jgi:hypothetical protein
LAEQPLYKLSDVEFVVEDFIDGCQEENEEE